MLEISAAVYGRGGTVGRGLGVGVDRAPVAVAVAVGVADAATVDVAVAVGVADAATVDVAVAVGVADAAAVAVAVAVGVGEAAPQGLTGQLKICVSAREFRFASRPPATQMLLVPSVSTAALRRGVVNGVPIDQ